MTEVFTQPRASKLHLLSLWSIEAGKLRRNDERLALRICEKLVKRQEGKAKRKKEVTRK